MKTLSPPASLLLAAMVVLCFECAQAEAQPATRHDFVAAMAKIKEGMTAAEVTQLLGKPDDVRTHSDPGGISTTRTKEIWRYGTDGHLTFATLGCVYLDKQDKVQYVYGGSGAPPDAMFTEKELRRLLRLIDKAPSYNSGYHYDPLAVIRIVNELWKLGKLEALAAIDEYLRVAPGFHDSGREGVFLVLRVLFDVPADPGYMPYMAVGAPWPGSPRDAKKIPRFPILLEDDVPLLLVTGYMLGGVAEQPESHVKYFREKGKIRERPLRPGNAPLGLLDFWVKNAAKLYDNADIVEQGKLLIANQLLNLVDSVYRIAPDAQGYKFWPDDNVDGRWKTIADEVGRKSIRWDDRQSCYVFKDGTRLPEPVKKHYRRQIWPVKGLNGTAEVILERQDAKRVWICLSWSGTAKVQMPAYVLDVLAVKDKANPLPHARTSSFTASGGDEAFSSQSFEVELLEGAEVLLRMTIGKEEQQSPVFDP